MGSFMHPVGPQPAGVYWRRRILLLGIPLVLIALTVYSCTASGPSSGQAGHPANSASATPSTGVITPGPLPTGTLPPIDSYPVTGPTGTGSGTPTSSSSAGSGGSGAGGAGGSGGNGGGGTSVSAGCALSVSVTLDKTASGGAPPVYANGSAPVFHVALTNSGTANCRVDVSGRGLVVTVADADGAVEWSSATCSGATDLRALGPGDGYTEQVAWQRQTSQSGCPTSPRKVPNDATYTVTVEASGVSSAPVSFVLQ